MEFYDILRELRKDRGLSQKELAALTNLSQSNISSWEINRSIPMADALIKLSNFFGVTIDYLVGRTAEEDVITITGNDLSEDENFLVDNVRQLNVQNKEIVYQYVSFLLQQQKKGRL